MTFYIERKYTKRKPSPLVGEGVNRQVDRRGKLKQIRKTVSYGMVLSTCLSFLNDVMASEPFFEEQSDAVKMSETPYPTNGSGKNLAKDTGIKYSDRCTHTCPYRLARLGTSLRIRGKLTLRKKDFIVSL